MEIGNKILELRKKNNLSQEKLSGIILKILKGIGIFLLVFIIVYLIIIILSFAAVNGLKTNKSVEIIEEIIIEE